MNSSYTLPLLLVLCGLLHVSDGYRHNSCSKGWFGYDCNDRCHCRAKGCDGDGICSSDYGCAPKWTGTRCDEERKNATISYQCLDSDDGLKHLKVRIDTHGVHYRDVSAVDIHKKEQPWCWDTMVSSLHKPRDVITISIQLSQRARRGMRDGKCAGKMIGPDIYEWMLTIQEWKKVTLGMQQNVLIRCNFNQSESHTRHTNVSPEKPHEIHFTKLEETRDNVELVLLDDVTRQEVNTAPIGHPVILQMRYGEPLKSVTPRNCYVTTAKQDRWQQIVDYNGCNVTESPVQPFRQSSDANAVETPWFPYFAYDGSPYTQYQCAYKACYDKSCVLGCTRGRHIRSASDSDDVVISTVP